MNWIKCEDKLPARGRWVLFRNDCTTQKLARRSWIFGDKWMCRSGMIRKIVDWDDE